jgi:hypothetical protein
MSRLVIEFEWARDPKGYRLTGGSRPTMQRVVRKGRGQRELIRYRPLSVTDALFRIFAHMADTPQGLLKFVERYGPLRWDGMDPAQGDDVSLALSNADHIRQILELWAGPSMRSKPASGQLGAPVSLLADIAWDAETKALKWELRPVTLLDAIWLQLGQALARGAEIRQCRHCGDWFEAGGGLGRRADAKFCSEAHKIAYHSLNRSRED